MHITCVSVHFAHSFQRHVSGPTQAFTLQESLRPRAATRRKMPTTTLFGTWQYSFCALTKFKVWAKKNDPGLFGGLADWPLELLHVLAWDPGCSNCKTSKPSLF